MTDLENTSKRFGRVVSFALHAKIGAFAYFKDGVLLETDTLSVRLGKPSTRVRRITLPFLIHQLDRFQVHAVLVPETRPKGSRRRGSEAAKAITAVTREALARGCAVHVLSTKDVKDELRLPNGKPARNLADVNRAVLERFPEMVTRLPRPRLKPWDPERYSTPLFGAVARYVAWERQLSPMDKRRTTQKVLAEC